MDVVSWPCREHTGQGEGRGERIRQEDSAPTPHPSPLTIHPNEGSPLPPGEGQGEGIFTAIDFDPLSPALSRWERGYPCQHCRCDQETAHPTYYRSSCKRPSTYL
jgi:hypothetical protein